MRAVIFDCDGVLLDSEAIGVEVERACLAEYGLHYEHEEFMARFLGVNAEFFFSALDTDHRSHFGTALPDSFQEYLRKRVYEAFERDLAVIPGIPSLVEELDCAMAVASGSSVEGLQWKLKKTDLHAQFDPHIYSANEVPQGKPAPDVFLLAAERLEIAPQDCVVVEDGRNGVLGAVAAGMTVIGFTAGGHCGPRHGDGLREAGAMEVAASVEALREVLQSRREVR